MELVTPCLFFALDLKYITYIVLILCVSALVYKGKIKKPSMSEILSLFRNF